MCTTCRRISIAVVVLGALLALGLAEAQAGGRPPGGHPNPRGPHPLPHGLRPNLPGPPRPSGQHPLPHGHPPHGWGGLHSGYGHHLYGYGHHPYGWLPRPFVISAPMGGGAGGSFPGGGSSDGGGYSGYSGADTRYELTDPLKQVMDWGYIPSPDHYPDRMSGTWVYIPSSEPRPTEPARRPEVKPAVPAPIQTAAPAPRPPVVWRYVREEARPSKLAGKPLAPGGRGVGGEGPPITWRIVARD